MKSGLFSTVLVPLTMGLAGVADATSERPVSSPDSDRTTAAAHQGANGHNPAPPAPAAIAFNPTRTEATPPGFATDAPQLNPLPLATLSVQLPPLAAASTYLPEIPDIFDGYTWPARGLLSSGYGWRWGRMHQGIDIAAPIGTPIVAAGSGVVQTSEWNSGGYGNLVEILHPNGSITRYAHNHRNLVRAGQKVEAGELIAEMGSTGFSTGPHLHFEIHLPEEGAVNPLALLPEAGLAARR
ncbi:M23 family metallopeptidase [Oxynema sp. CENA135]|uniref:M23 family metallopeptidase n=1 Tax=Oxynema sp. CENA135 TaxID=984206 RepID=UPI001909BA7F|nr:M23 family metallopeptidase [Oxynema sp. CENA135]MBK4728826.1 M23 family metallopeptidase [Oxynema sp. CENA135]